MQVEYTDQEILDLLKKDSEKAIDILFRQHYSFLCRSVYKILPDENLVEDLSQEVFYELWRKRAKLQIKTSLKAYLRRAAINKALNFIRDQKIKFNETENDRPIISKRTTVNQQLEAEELQEIIDQAIDQLPERYRTVFVLSRIEEMSYNEIAEQLGISVKTVENQISKALKQLRLSLADYLNLIILLLCPLF